MRINSPEDAAVLLQKIPSDTGIHRNPRKGTLNAPHDILEDFVSSKKFLADEVFTDEFDLEETHSKIENNTEELVRYDKPLISLGGDHSISFNVIKVLKNRYPGMQLVWLDSHLDAKEKVESHVSHDVVVRELLENGFEPEDIYFVGITRIDEDEEDFIEGKAFNIYQPDELEDFKGEFNPDEQPVYLSIDIDVLKQELAPGTGYPDGELELEQVLDVIDHVNPRFADLVEVAPPLDKDDKTLENAREILEALLDSAARY